MFRDVSIEMKMKLNFCVVVLLGMIIGIVAITQNARLAALTADISLKNLPGMASAAAIDTLVSGFRHEELLMRLAPAGRERDSSAARNQEILDRLKKETAEYEKLIANPDELKAYRDFVPAWGRYLEGYQKLSVDLNSASYSQVAAALEQMKKASLEASKKKSASALKITSAAQSVIIALVCLCILVGTVLAAMFSRTMSNPLRRLAADAEQVASGNLGVTVSVASHDEFGQLSQSFEKMVNNLREMIGTLADSSSHISESSSEMQLNATHMANGAEEVAVQAITVATASEEMSATSGDIAQNCLLAAESARRANQAAEEGGAVVEKSIDVMHRIAERVQQSARTVEELGHRSDQIGSIIGTIEDIADQTNLLALNAAIEAARAGEQGRGFAVVADEVRALAERTTRATHEIGEMIKAIQGDTIHAVATMEEGVAEVEQGTVEAGRSGEALRHIRDEITALNMQVQQIATAAEEQTATTSEISHNIIKITGVAQDTVSGARSTADAARHLARLSDELQNVVGQFRLSDSNRMIEWSRSYSVGVSRMDDEHKRLINIINGLYAAMCSGRSRDAIEATLKELADYTRTHFAHEEQLMKDAHYAGYDEQKRAHEALISQMSDIQEKYHSGTALGQEVMNFLKNWLINHIQGLDKQYGPVMNKRGIR